jgi:ABC-type branched-subunit amino acid transport system substrate-binding protein
VRSENLLPWGTPYQLQAINGVGYALSKASPGARDVCTLGLATGYGQATEEGVDYLAQAMGVNVPVKARFKQDDQDFVAPISQLKNASCDIVMVTSLPSVTGKVLGAAAQLSYAPRWVLTSPSWHHTLAASPLKVYLTKNVWISWDGPDYGDTTVAGMREMLAAMATYAPEQKPDWYYAAAYVMAYPVHALLEKAVASGDLTRSGLRMASQTIGTVSYGGMLSPYMMGAAAQRNPPRTGTIFKVDPSAPLGMVTERAGFSVPAAQSYTFEHK